jgi:serine O-acetyltransferase
MSTWDLICADLSRAWERDVPSSLRSRLALMLACAGTVRGLATIGFRVSHAVGRRSALLGTIVKQLNQVITGCDIGHQAQIGPGFRMLHPNGVVINSAVVVGSRFTVHQGVTLGGSARGAPVIGDDVNLAPGSRVLGAVRLGNRVLLGANAVLTKTIDGDGIVLAGVPARVLREVREGDFREAPIDAGVRSR